MILTSTQVKKKKTTLFGWLADLYVASGREKKAPLFGEPEYLVAEPGQEKKTTLFGWSFYNSAPC